MTQISKDILLFLQKNPTYHTRSDITKQFPNYKARDISEEIWHLSSEGRVHFNWDWKVKATFKHESWI